MKPTTKRSPTPFQQRVYTVVRRIPKGEVRSYGWVAEQLGDPKLARAVGQALNRNQRPDLIPCHRVVRADGSLGRLSHGSRSPLASGSLGGYAWGQANKQRLLQGEGALGTS